MSDEPIDLEAEKQKRGRRRNIHKRSDERVEELRGLKTAKYDLSASAQENEPALELAREMFMAGFTFTDITIATRIPETVFKMNAYTPRAGVPSWEEQKQAYVLRQMEAATVDKVEELAKVRGLTITNLRIALERMHLRMTIQPDSITVKDVKLMSDMLANFDRITRLDLGKPTDIQKKYESFTREQLREELKAAVEELRENDPALTFEAELPNHMDYDSLQKRH